MGMVSGLQKFHAACACGRGFVSTGSLFILTFYHKIRSSFQTNDTRTFHRYNHCRMFIVELGRYVFLGADTRATDDRMVADKRCEKIHRISTNVFCCGAGTSADLDALTRLAQYSLALQALETSSIGNGNRNDSSPHQPSLEQEHYGGILLQPISVSVACRFLRDALYDAGGSLGVNLIQLG